VNRNSILVLPALALAGAFGPDGAAAGSTSTRDALSVLGTVRVANERSAGYKRSLFTLWIDADRDGCNTREEVLIAESSGPPQVDSYGCKVLAGDWWSPYDDVDHSDPSDLDIDHLVPLKDAWDSGAWAWSSAKRRAFANDLSDPRPLIAVTSGVNRSKGDKDPSNWLPPNASYVCTYLSDWVAVKSRWGLSMDQSEFGRVRKLLTGRCAGTSLAAWGTARGPVVGRTDPTSDDPETTETTVVKGTSSFKPGQFCAPLGARGTYTGRSYVCSKSNAQGVPYKDFRARWRQG
jgi:hypothetical protein